LNARYLDIHGDDRLRSHSKNVAAAWHGQSLMERESHCAPEACGNEEPIFDELGAEPAPIFNDREIAAVLIA